MNQLFQRAALLMLAATSSCAAGLAHGSSQEKPDSAGKTPEEVIVEAQRIELQRRAYDFVSGMTGRGYMVQSLARWNEPICPLVAGIPVAQGEFILQQLSNIMRAAGAPLAGTECDPNFHVVLTYDPDELMRLWRKRTRGLFGEAPPSKVRRIMNKPKPIRVWRNTWEACAAAQPSGSLSAPLNIGGNTEGWGFMSDCPSQATRLSFNYVKLIQSVIVIVDLNDIKDVKIGALADYIAMVGLAEVNLEADLGDAPTVLHLFAASGDPAPQGMSSWDLAFLKGLYGTTQASRSQRSTIAEEMVRDFMGR